jgi:hypothetical protein
VGRAREITVPVGDVSVAVYGTVCDGESVHAWIAPPARSVQLLASAADRASDQHTLALFEADIERAACSGRDAHTGKAGAHFWEAFTGTAYRYRGCAAPGASGGWRAVRIQGGAPRRCVRYVIASGYVETFGLLDFIALPVTGLRARLWAGTEVGVFVAIAAAAVLWLVGWPRAAAIAAFACHAAQLLIGAAICAARVDAGEAGSALPWLVMFAMVALDAAGIAIAISRRMAIAFALAAFALGAGYYAGPVALVVSAIRPAGYKGRARG